MVTVVQVLAVLWAITLTPAQSEYAAFPRTEECSACGYDPETGKRHWVGTGFCDTEEEREQNQSCKVCTDDNCDGGFYVGTCPSEGCGDAAEVASIDWLYLDQLVQRRAFAQLDRVARELRFERSVVAGQLAYTLLGCGQAVIGYIVVPTAE